MQKKYFTVEEANALLPFIREEITALQNIRNEFRQKYLELSSYKKKHENQTTTHAYQDSIFKMEGDLEFIEIQFQMHVNTVHSHGILLKETDPGLVDFPSLLDEEEVLLCWREGEEKITHYHGLHDGFAGRKKLV